MKHLPYPAHSPPRSRGLFRLPSRLVGTALLALLLALTALLLSLFYFVRARPAAQPPPPPAAHLSPNGDGLQEEVAVRVTLAAGSEVRVVVQSARGDVIRTLLAGDRRAAGEQDFVWDGRDDRGRVVADGHYELIVLSPSGAPVAAVVPIQVDTRPPAATLTFPQDNLTTRDDTLVVEGEADAGSLVYVGGVDLPVVVDERGRFRVSRPLEEGLNPLDVRVVDPAGNERLLSRMVTRRTMPPSLVLLEPGDGEARIEDGALLVRGTVPPDVAVTVNNGPVEVGPRGEFEQFVTLAPGEEEVRVVARDALGNEKVLTRRLQGSPGGAEIDRAPVVEAPPLDVSAPLEALERRLQTLPVPGGFSWSWVAALLSLFFGTLLTYRLFVRPLRYTLSVDHPIFYPSRRSQKRLLVVRFHLNRPAKVRLDVYDEFNRHLVTLVAGRRLAAGEHFRLWDGRGSMGQRLPAGSYLIQGSARERTRSRADELWVRLDPTGEEQAA